MIARAVEVGAGLGLGADAFVDAEFVADGFDGLRGAIKALAELVPRANRVALVLNVVGEDVFPRHHGR